jgi:hypothetical protein
MRWMALLTSIVALLLQAANAHVVRHSSIPQAYWGTWTTTGATCADGDKSAIVLSAKAYVGPAARCAVDSVSETPGEQGATYSARLQCANATAKAQKKSVANLIIRPDGTDRISVGPTFDNLAAYQRCGSAGPSAGQ